MVITVVVMAVAIKIMMKRRRRIMVVIEMVVVGVTTLATIMMKMMKRCLEFQRNVLLRVRSYQHGRTRTTVVGEKRAQEIALYSHW